MQNDVIKDNGVAVLYPHAPSRFENLLMSLPLPDSY